MGFRLDVAHVLLPGSQLQLHSASDPEHGAFNRGIGFGFMGLTVNARRLSLSNVLKEKALTVQIVEDVTAHVSLRISTIMSAPQHFDRLQKSDS